MLFCLFIFDFVQYHSCDAVGALGGISLGFGIVHKLAGYEEKSLGVLGVGEGGSTQRLVKREMKPKKCRVLAGDRAAVAISLFNFQNISRMKSVFVLTDKHIYLAFGNDYYFVRVYNALGVAPGSA